MSHLFVSEWPERSFETEIFSEIFSFEFLRREGQSSVYSGECSLGCYLFRSEAVDRGSFLLQASKDWVQYLFSKVRDDIQRLEERRRGHRETGFSPPSLDLDIERRTEELRRLIRSMVIMGSEMDLVNLILDDSTIRLEEISHANSKVS